VSGWGYLFRAFSRGFDSIEATWRDLDEIVNQSEDERKRSRVEVSLRGLNWIQLYDRTPLGFAKAVVRALPAKDLIETINPFRYRALLSQLHDGTMDEPKGEIKGEQAVRIFNVSIALRNNLNAALVHGRPLNMLLADFYKGDDSALFSAITIDPAILGLSRVSERHQIALGTRDQVFLGQLRRALSEQKKERAYSRLDLALFAMAWVKQVERLDKRSAERLFISETKFYSNHGIDPVGSLWRHVYRWKKANRTFIDQRMSS
tara:strand:- start:2514 stop:3299 length:786 start_codon:yes stop_codon:yes gene_type:complete